MNKPVNHLREPYLLNNAICSKWHWSPFSQKCLVRHPSRDQIGKKQSPVAPITAQLGTAMQNNGFRRQGFEELGKRRGLEFLAVRKPSFCSKRPRVFFFPEPEIREDTCSNDTWRGLGGEKIWQLSRKARAIGERVDGGPSFGIQWTPLGIRGIYYASYLGLADTATIQLEVVHRLRGLAWKLMNNLAVLPPKVPSWKMTRFEALKF